MNAGRAEMLAITDLTVRFEGLTAVRDASLSIAEGDIYGLIGPNGAGKSTLFNAVSGIVATSGGRIRFAGADISHEPPHRRSAGGIRRTFQSVQLINQLTVLENVLIGLHPKITLRPMDFLRLWGRNRTEAEARLRVREVLDLVGFRGRLDQEVRSLSFADQRLVEMARALVTAPKLLLLDEPAAGLSPPEAERFVRLVRRLRDERNLTVLLVEHVISLVMGLCDRISVLDNGVIIAAGDPQTIAADPKVRAAYLGEDAHARGH